jgi:hypothetical protein
MELQKPNRKITLDPEGRKVNIMSKPSWEVCIDQLRRIHGLDSPETEQSLVTELVGTLMRVAASNDHVTRMITRWVLTEESVPRIADLYLLAITVPPVDPLPVACSLCATEDWVEVECDMTWFRARCDCVRGRVLRRMDKYHERLLSAPTKQ